MNSLDDFGTFEAKSDRYPTLGFGTYLLEVIENSVIPVKKGKSEALLRAFKVLEANPIDVAGSPSTPTASGTDAKAKLLYLDQEYVEDRIGEYVAPLVGSKKISGSDVKIVFGDDNPTKGLKIRARVEPKTSKAGKEFHLYTWTHVPGQELPAAEPNRKAKAK